MTWEWETLPESSPPGTPRYVVFTAGVLSGFAAVSAWQLARRYHSPSPERVFATVLPMLRANTECRTLLGGQLKPGLFRAYAYAGGLQASHSTLLSYTPREWSHSQTKVLPQSEYETALRALLLPGSLQLMFQVLGEKGVSGMVSLAVRRRVPWSSALEFSSIAVDLPTGERLLLKGGNEDVVFQGYTRLR